MTDLGTGYYKITNANSSKAMVVQSASTSTGAYITQYDYSSDTTTNDEWQLVDAGGGYYYLVNHYSGLYLDNSGNSTTNGTQFIQWSSNGGDNQKFQFTYLR